MGRKWGKGMSPTSLAKLAEKKKSLTHDRKQVMLKAGGSVKTNHTIDAQEICRENRGKQ